jgi:oxygen-independent coproporphyrinogen-3 oxidase
VGECDEEKEKYIGYLMREMDLYLDRFQISKIKPRSILLGGGTPTDLKPDLFEHFLSELGSRLDLSACRQYNVDHDPNSILGDDGIRRLEAMKKAGITRLTIGVQSLNDDVLKRMNRPHSAAEAEEAVRRAVDYGFDVNIEFIYGYPGETFENWVEVIDRAVTLPVGEIQLYRLKVQTYGDAQGPINRLHRGSALGDIPDFRTTMMMKQMAIDVLNENGYHETLRRVYAKDKRVFSHYAYNQCCNQYDQVGFGITGFSSYRDRFDINTQYFPQYYQMVDEGRLTITRAYKRSADDQIRWAIVLPLKNRDIRKADFRKHTGIEFDTVFRKKMEILTKYGLIEDTGKVVRLTELGGFVADEVCEQFNGDNFKPFPRERYADGPLNPYNFNRVLD